MLRDYNDLLSRIDKLPAHRKVIGTAGGYPILTLELSPNDSIGELESATTEAKSVLICAGIHGDEPAGVEALLEFLEQGNTQLVDGFNFLIYPCNNPHGYVHNRRDNSDGADINRTFKTDETSEAVMIKESLSGRRFHVIIDLHEDYDSVGFYLYEQRRSGELIGGRIIETVEDICPINRDTVIDQVAASDGMITQEMYSDDPRYHSMRSHTWENHTDHAIALESPTGLPLRARVDAHLAGIETILEYYHDKM